MSKVWRDENSQESHSSVPAEELRAAEDEAIVAALKLQREVGLTSWTDGEMRR